VIGTGQSCRQLTFRIAPVIWMAFVWSTANASTSSLPAPPDVRSTNHVAELTLSAVTDPAGHAALSFNGGMVPPTIRVSPGDILKVTYVNAMARTFQESCANGVCMNMTNLHFHGLGVSPRQPQDDVLHMMAMPGQTLHYRVAIPSQQPPGLYWYHTHPHGESQRQALDGMSGAIVVEGIDQYVPAVSTMPERVLVIRGRDIEHAPDAASLRRQAGIPETPCGSAAEPEPAERIMTVNGVLRPEIPIAAGERQFWRIVNAGADTFVDLQIDGQPMDIVAFDGFPVGYYEKVPREIQPAEHRPIPPGGRLEVVVTGPPNGVHASLRSRCVDTGPAGDPNPEMVLADVVSGTATPSSSARTSRTPDGRSRSAPATHRHPSFEALERTEPQFVATFSEDEHGFYINGQLFAADAKPMVEVTVGTYQHWRIVNDSDELHPMHLHQVHFLAYAENGVPLANPVWLDTVNVPSRGTVDIIVDFTNPVIRGMSVFHCHLLNHEDKGMMAKILLK